MDPLVWQALAPPKEARGGQVDASIARSHLPLSSLWLHTFPVADHGRHGTCISDLRRQTVTIGSWCQPFVPRSTAGVGAFIMFCVMVAALFHQLHKATSLCVQRADRRLGQMLH